VQGIPRTVSTRIRCPIPPACADSLCICMDPSCMCACAFLLVLVSVVRCFLHHNTHTLRRTQHSFKRNRVCVCVCVCVRARVCVCECVYFTSHPFLRYFIQAPITALRLMLIVVTAAKPERRTPGVCFTCLFSQESLILLSILPPPSAFYCLQHRAAQMSGVRWGSGFKTKGCVYTYV